MKSSVFFVVFLVLGVSLMIDLSSAQTYRGFTTRILVRRTSSRWYCACWYWYWGCSYGRYYTYTWYTYITRCATGYRHNGDYNCNIPICRPRCLNGGTCVSPNYCDCPDTYTGRNCGEATCSYQRPCYPGDCSGGTTYNCTCEAKFRKENVYDGCIIFNDTSLKPFIGRSTATLANVRRSDNRTNFMFVMDGTMTDTRDVIWSNQRIFNTLRFEFEALFQPTAEDEEFELPDRPNYVHDAEMGVVHSEVKALITSIPRDANQGTRDVGYNHTYLCDNGVSRDNPAVELANCSIYDNQFKTAIEHGDNLIIKFRSTSGGFQKLVNTDQNSVPYGTKYYRGLQDIKEVEFKFDFIAPKHCTEPAPFQTCNQLNIADPHILRVGREFTKENITMSWGGWTDDLSGIWEYYVEIFKLGPDPYKRLVELTPLKPVFSKTVLHSTPIPFPSHGPREPGMYSVLMETRDIANNSRITRRLVLFDNQSKIELSALHPLHVASAEEETGYKWQTVANTSSGIVTFRVNWHKHFINRIHDDGYFLNKVLPYPTQFKEIQDDGVLFSKKYVNASLDDNEGNRTLAEITHFNGIVKFEMAKVFTKSEVEPAPSDWKVIPLEEDKSETEFLENGAQVRFWVRATDIMGNTEVDNTVVRIDGTVPYISHPGTADRHVLEKNVINGSTAYSSRVTFSASDDQSGVHKIGVKIYVKTSKGTLLKYDNFTDGRVETAGLSAQCKVVDGVCFIPEQIVYLDNCKFMVSKTELDNATAVVEMTAFNQALLTASVTFQVGKIKELKGLEKFSGPKNIRIENETSRGFRVAWDLPEEESCYGRADIIIIIAEVGPSGNTTLKTYYTHGLSEYFDILGLKPNTDYNLVFSIRDVADTKVSFKARTELDCGTPGKGTNTGSPTVTDTMYKSTATYTCLPGFDIADQGDLTITCQQNGTWEPVPTCTLKLEPVGSITCPESIDQRGQLWNPSEANTTPSLSCARGYNGQIERHCDSNGVYHPAIYNCTLETIFNLKNLSFKEGWNSTEILDKLSEIVDDDNETMYEGDLSVIGEILSDVAENFTGSQADTDTFYNIVDNLIDEDHSLSWGSLEKTSGNGAETILHSVDKANEKIMAAVINGKMTENVTVDGENLYLSVRIIEEKNDMIVFPEESERSLTHWTNKEMATIYFPLQHGRDNRLVYAGILYRNASELLSSKTAETSRKPNRRGKNAVLNSAVISFSLPKSHSGKLKDPVTIRFKTIDKNRGKSVCSFLNLTTKRWETNGCWKDSHSIDHTSDVITCKCNHLTNFALLMSPVGVSHLTPLHSRSLSILTVFGLTLSSVCLIVNIIIYVLFWRFIVSEASIIIINICIVLLVANAVFIFGVGETSDADVCTAIAVVLHFLYLALFLLLLAVGINLTMNAMSTKKRKLGALLCCLAYVLAGVIVGISAGSYQLEGYGNENFCWLGDDSGQIWTFIGPALAVILTNFCLIVVVMRKYLGLSINQKKDSPEKLKAAAKALAAMLSATGVAWFFGLLSVNNETLVFQYLFVVFNSLQGVFIFVFYGVMNIKIKRKLYERFAEKSSCTGNASVAKQSVQSSDRFLTSDV